MTDFELWLTFKERSKWLQPWAFAPGTIRRHNKWIGKKTKMKPHLNPRHQPKNFKGRACDVLYSPSPASCSGLQLDPEESCGPAAAEAGVCSGGLQIWTGEGFSGLLTASCRSGGAVMSGLWGFSVLQRAFRSLVPVKLQHCQVFIKQLKKIKNKKHTKNFKIQNSPELSSVISLIELSSASVLSSWTFSKISSEANETADFT